MQQDGQSRCSQNDKMEHFTFCLPQVFFNQIYICFFKDIRKIGLGSSLGVVLYTFFSSKLSRMAGLNDCFT